MGEYPEIEEHLQQLIDDAIEAGVQKIFVSVTDLSEAITLITVLKNALLIAGLPKDEWENCPNCPNQGFTVREYAEDRYEQEQCEFCYTNPRSVFYQENQLWKEK